MDKQTLYTLVEQNKFKRIFEALQQVEGIETHDLVMQKSQYNRLEDQEMMGVISREHYTVELNKIRRNLLSFIENYLPNTNLMPTNLIMNPILVISQNEEKIAETAQFFNRLNFGQVEVLHTDTVPNTEKYDLIIFDNRHLPFMQKVEQMPDNEIVRKRIDLMKRYIEQSHNFLLHWGETLFLVNDYRDRIGAANSKFTIYARIRELLDFMRAYRA